MMTACGKLYSPLATNSDGPNNGIPTVWGQSAKHILCMSPWCTPAQLYLIYSGTDILLSTFLPFFSGSVWVLQKEAPPKEGNSVRGRGPRGVDS